MLLRNGMIGLASAMAIFTTFFTGLLQNESDVITTNIQILKDIKDSGPQINSDCYKRDNGDQVCWKNPEITKLNIYQELLLCLVNFTRHVLCVKEKGSSETTAKCFYGAEAHRFKSLMNFKMKGNSGGGDSKIK